MQQSVQTVSIASNDYQIIITNWNGTHEHFTTICSRPKFHINHAYQNKVTSQTTMSCVQFLTGTLQISAQQEKFKHYFLRLATLWNLSLFSILCLWRSINHWSWQTKTNSYLNIFYSVLLQSIKEREKDSKLLLDKSRGFFLHVSNRGPNNANLDVTFELECLNQLWKTSFKKQVWKL